MATQHSRNQNFFQRIFFILFFVCLVWSFGFAQFILSIVSFDGTLPTADGIVVLTGGHGRIDAGLKALKERRGARLLISGVNQELNTEIIMQAISGDMALLECCIDLGPLATDTVSNAEETAMWAHTNGYKTVIIITSDYHMPRTLVAFDPYRDDLEVVPVTVKSGASPILLMGEYNKYLLSLAGFGVKI